MLLLCYIKLLHFISLMASIFRYSQSFFFFALEGPNCWTEFLKIFLLSKVEKNSGHCKI